MALSQEQIDRLADAALDAFNDLEGKLKSRAGVEIAKLGAADRDALRVALSRISRDDKRTIERVVRDTLQQAAAASLSADEETYAAARAAGLIAPYAEAASSSAIARILKDGVATAQSLANLVRTSAEQRVYAGFLEALDGAMLGVTSGAVAPADAITGALDRIARQTTVVTYAQADGTVLEQGLYGAVRRAVLTSSNQLTARLTEARALELGVTTFEVSAHLGARPDHAEWQGQVYTLDELVSVCEYGDGAGLAGWNCRHTFFPFVPGVSEPTDWSWADDPSGEEYELSQRQRECERNIRGYKARAAAYSGVANEADDEAVRAWAAERRKSSTELSKKWQREADDVAAKRGGGGRRRPDREVGRFERAR